jgi:iron complex transport system ATP-binding protein
VTGAVLKLEGLTVGYGARGVLDGVSLAIERGEILALIGPNGAGKSTLIRAASGILVPAQGRVTVDGDDLRGLSTALRARRIAVAPQAIHFPEAFTARDTVLLGRTPHLGWLGRESPADRDLAAEAMRRTCTQGLEARRLGEISSGERQLVFIARALAQSAPFLLMDEPTAHLDLKHQALVLALARDLAHSDHLGVLVALHDLNLAAQFADRIALLSAGKLAATGTPREVLTADRLRAAYGVPVSIHEHPVRGVPVIFAE